MKGKRSFTLIEMMVVVAIVAMLAVVLVVQVSRMIDKGKVSRAKGDVRSIANAILEYHNDVGTWPRQVFISTTACGEMGASGLTRLSDGTAGPLVRRYPGVTGWKGPYLDKDIPATDPWGNSYLYGEFFDEINSFPTEGCIGTYSYVLSPGPNGNIDSDTATRTTAGDDIVIWLE